MVYAERLSSDITTSSQLRGFLVGKVRFQSALEDMLLTSRSLFVR